MKYEIEEISKQYGLILLIYTFGMFLNMQKSMLGYNFSLSDVLICLIIIKLIFEKKLVIEKYSLFFLLYLLIFNITNSLFFVIPKFSIELTEVHFFSELIKLLTSFLFFQVAINLTLLRKDEMVYRGLVLLSFIMGVLSLIFNIFHISSEFFIDGERYIGLLSDPNYFAVLQCCSIAVILFSEFYKMKIKAVLFIGVSFGIVFSASKTGMIIYLILIISYIIFKIIKAGITGEKIIYISSSFIIILLTAKILSEKIEAVILSITINYPILDRVILLFTDSRQAVTANGSTRDEVWLYAQELIKEFPMWGVGFGNYLSVVKKIFGDERLAHNTVLQLVAEWGAVFSVVLFIVISIVWVKSIHNKLYNDFFVLTVLIIGAQSLSLNNSRVLWVFFAINYAKVFLISKENKYDKDRLPLKRERRVK